MKQKVASLPRRVVRSVSIKKGKFHVKQSLCLDGRETRRDIYMCTGYLCYTLDRYITQVLIYSVLHIHAKKVLAKKICLILTVADLGRS
jgi:hypothetical protein